MPLFPETNDQAGRPGLALLPLFIALALMLLMTVLPSLATDRNSQADHPAAMLIFWSMSAGFVRGVGFVPTHSVPRWLFSGRSCVLALMLAIARLAWLGRINLPL